MKLDKGRRIGTVCRGVSGLVTADASKLHLFFTIAFCSLKKPCAGCSSFLYSSSRSESVKVEGWSLRGCRKELLNSTSEYRCSSAACCIPEYVKLLTALQQDTADRTCAADCSHTCPVCGTTEV